MTDEWDYSEETVIGHHVQARIESKSAVDKVLDDVAEDIGMSRRYMPMVKIEVGDVDWEETRQIRIRLDTLVELTETLKKEYDDD